MENTYTILAAGGVLIAIVIFQVLSGLGKIKVSPKYHKTGGLILFALAIIHAAIGTIYLLK